MLHTPGAVAVFTALGDILHVRNYRLVFEIRQPVTLTLAILIIGIATDTQESTHYADWPGLLVLGDKRVFQRVSLAKNSVVSSTGQRKYSLQLLHRCQVVERFPRSFIQLPGKCI